MAKMTKPADIRAKTPDEQAAMLIELKREQFNLRFRAAAGEAAGAGQVRKVRRDIARLKTIQAERARAAVQSGKE